jgi:hypothetical protein
MHALLLDIAITLEAFAADISRPTEHTKNVIVHFWQSTVVRQSDFADVSIPHGI